MLDGLKEKRRRLEPPIRFWGHAPEKCLIFDSQKTVFLHLYFRFTSNFTINMIVSNIVLKCSCPFFFEIHLEITLLGRLIPLP